MVGDFNCHHPAWGGPGVAREPKAEHLVMETERRGLEVLNESGVPTWERGNSATTIDLAFATADIAASITRYMPRPEWTVMKDHFPIEIQISRRVMTGKPSTRFAIKDAPWGAIQDSVRDSQWYSEDPHKSIAKLIDTIHQALDQNCKRTRPSDWSRPEFSPVAAKFLAGA